MKKIILIASFALVAGCATSGNETLKQVSETSITTMIVEGQTTKADVKKQFGSPLKTTFTDGGLETWTYEFSKVHLTGKSYIPIVNIWASGTTGTKKELVVLFDEKGIVKRYAMNESQIDTKSGS